MEMAMVRANIEEDPEATMARFLGGLNREIANMVELYHYVDLEEMMHRAVLIEKQLKRKGSLNKVSSNTSWKKPSWEKKDEAKKTPTSTSSTKDKFAKTSTSSNSTSSSRGVTCFKCLGKGHIASQCPNSKTMIMLDDGTIMSESEKGDSSEDEMPPLMENDENEQVEPEGEAVVM